MLKVFLDDIRIPSDVYPNESNWVTVTTASECIDMLTKNHVDVLSLDHDLGDDSDGTGYDVLRWLEEQVYMHDYEAPLDIRVHSANPVGRARMLSAITSIKRL
jgi:hypothetical protein